MKRLFTSLTALCLLGASVFWWLSEPEYADTQSIGSLTPSVENGELVFWAGGCASCHSEKNAKGEDKLKLGGGHALQTPFGTFLSPNISPDRENGIGSWSNAEFLNAMTKGVAPNGSHLYPSFPYTSYARMNEQDVVDLFAYIKTLPAIAKPNQPHDLPLPFRWRRTLGVWKTLFLDDANITSIDQEDAMLMRGQYLVEGLGHCGECHTPRNAIGGLDFGNWLAGGPAPEGEGRIPNITPHADGIEGWSETDIAYYLESGFTPDYDSAGGSMTDVVSNMSKLPKEDRKAIAKYLKAIPSLAKQ